MGPQLTFVPGLHHDTVARGIIAGVYGTECTLATGSTQDMRVLGLREEKQRDIQTNKQLTMWTVSYIHRFKTSTHYVGKIDYRLRFSLRQHEL